ncbi:MAG: hypothetical protein JJU45_08515 [Acidimicrobiia bacterium]|nr:hypothetical protein [Acidimicrobiia bacterium]
MDSDGSTTSDVSGAATVTELIGVYHAEGTLRGELRYWIGARLGRAHCALCDITHGTFKEKESWRSCTADLPVPFLTYHLDDRPADVRAATERSSPAVLARTAVGVHALLGPAELERLDGDPQRLAEAIVGAVHAVGLGWPEAER